jgi:flagellin-like protein
MKKCLKCGKNKGVSAVVGVILMVAITVAIAFTTYVYVSDALTDKEYLYVEGNVTDKYTEGSYNASGVTFYLVLDYDNKVIVPRDTYNEYDIGDYYYG